HYSVALWQDPPVLQPREVQGLPRVRALRCGGHHMLASTEGGDLFVWGCGLTHQLANRPRDVSNPTDADEEPADELRPYHVSSKQLQSRFVIVADGGAQHSVELAFGGQYSTLSQALVLGAGPAQVARPLAQARLGQWFSALARALLHKPAALAHPEVLVAALAAASAVPVGDVFVHGSGECDQLGLSDDMRERKKPTLLKSLIGKSICEIAVGAMHVLCLSTGGAVYSWGCNDHGAPGRAPSDGWDGGPSDVEPHPVTMPSGVAVCHVSCGDCHNCALDEKRRVWLWGTYKDSNDYIGIAHKRKQETEVLEKSAEPPLVLVGCLQVSSGAMHTVKLQAVPAVRRASCIAGGLHITAALVDARDPPVLQPREDQELPRVRALRCGGHHLLARTEGGDPWLWGSGLTQLLANRPRDLSNSSDADERLTDELRSYEVSSKQRQKRFVIVEDGAVHGWGCNDDRALGRAPSDGSDSGPSDVEPHPVTMLRAETAAAERTRAADETMLKTVQGVHDKCRAARQRRTALVFIQAMGELVCCTPSSVDADELSQPRALPSFFSEMFEVSFSLFLSLWACRLKVGYQTAFQSAQKETQKRGERKKILVGDPTTRCVLVRSMPPLTALCGLGFRCAADSCGKADDSTLLQVARSFTRDDISLPNACNFSLETMWPNELQQPYVGVLKQSYKKVEQLLADALSKAQAPCQDVVLKMSLYPKASNKGIPMGEAYAGQAGCGIYLVSDWVGSLQVRVRENECQGMGADAISYRCILGRSATRQEEQRGAAHGQGVRGVVELLPMVRTVARRMWSHIRMLCWEYLWWTDFTIPVPPINWEIPREERRRQMDATMLRILQGVHDKAEWQRRTALGFFQAAAPTVSVPFVFHVAAETARSWLCHESYLSNSQEILLLVLLRMLDEAKAFGELPREGLAAMRPAGVGRLRDGVPERAEGCGCAAVSDHKAAVMWAERVQVPHAALEKEKIKELQANALLLACDDLFVERSAVAGSCTCAGLELPNMCEPLQLRRTEVFLLELSLYIVVDGSGECDLLGVGDGMPRGAVYSWGCNDDGSLGRAPSDGSDGGPSDVETEVLEKSAEPTLVLEGCVQVASGANHTVALAAPNGHNEVSKPRDSLNCKTFVDSPRAPCRAQAASQAWAASGKSLASRLCALISLMALHVPLIP
ncbi:rcc1, partial [Symbiodinium sp. CCMP2456]